MKKIQAFVLHLLILAILGGFAGFFLSITPNKSANTSRFQKNSLPEGVSTFLAEEEVNNEVSNLRKTSNVFPVDPEVWQPLQIVSPKECRPNPTDHTRKEKKFLLHLQLLI